MKWVAGFVLSLGVALGGLASVSANDDQSESVIWDACWSDDPSLTQRRISYPEPIHLVIHNISRTNWEICVYDKLCSHSLFNGLLHHNHSISLSACADKWGRGSVALMNAAGEMWHFDGTKDRVITIEK